MSGALGIVLLVGVTPGVISMTGVVDVVSTSGVLTIVVEFL